MRKQYVCKQHIHIITSKPGGKVMREETTQYEIVPTATGAQKQLKLLTGSMDTFFEHVVKTTAK